MSEQTSATTKLTIAHLRPDMVLAEPALNKLGVTILSKDTKLDNINFSKLKANNVITVTVYNDSIRSENALFVDSDHSPKKTIGSRNNPDRNSQEFKHFHLAYRQKINELKKCIEALNFSDPNHIKSKNLLNISNALLQTVNSKSDLLNFVSYLNNMDDFLLAHSINVSLLCNIFARYLNFSQTEIDNITIAGLLHDIGKTTSSVKIFKTLDPLSESEKVLYKRHPQLSYDIIKNQNDIADEVKNAVLTHHEFIDGSGYPKGLKGDEISNMSKVLSICNTYDHLISINHKCPFEVIKDFKTKYLGLLDTEYLLLFIENIMYTYTGSYVMLSNGKAAQVKFINSSSLSKPIVESEGSLIDLAKNNSLTIKCMA